MTNITWLVYCLVTPLILHTHWSWGAAATLAAQTGSGALAGFGSDLVRNPAVGPQSLGVCLHHRGRCLGQRPPVWSRRHHILPWGLEGEDKPTPPALGLLVAWNSWGRGSKSPLGADARRAPASERTLVFIRPRALSHPEWDLPSVPFRRGRAV